MGGKLGSQRREYGRLTLGGEASVYHCNFYNYWLQKTILLVPGLGMEEVVVAAAAASAKACLQGLGADGPMAQQVFAHAGFGLIDLSRLGADGGPVETTVSHYGQCLAAAAGVPFATPQSLFDAGFAAGAASALFEADYTASVEACMSVGAAKGEIQVRRAQDRDVRFSAYGLGPQPVLAPTPLDAPLTQQQFDDAVASLGLVGNDEGLIPRFGVMLTQHFAHFYNRISFEFLRRMRDGGMASAAERLLIDAGYRCAFHTIGGIFVSDEWAGMLQPHVESREDAIRLMIGLMSTLGWGRYRVEELSSSRIVVRIYDDYESLGYLAMYGRARRPVSFLATGGVAGLMNLVYLGDILDRPTLDNDYFEQVFEQPNCFRARTTMSRAMGDDYTEIIAER